MSAFDTRVFASDVICEISRFGSKSVLTKPDALWCIIALAQRSRRQCVGLIYLKARQGGGAAFNYKRMICYE